MVKLTQSLCGITELKISVSNRLRKCLIPLVGMLTACSSSLDRALFSLVPHPQEPEKRPYEVEEVEFINLYDGTRIAGELTYPHAEGSFPGVVLVSGHIGGEPPAGRNYEITGHKYFLVIAHLLTERGYAVLRYDNRGVGESSGDYTVATDEEYSSDAAAALKWLREDSGLRLSASGFLGHSQGGIKSLMAAEMEHPDYVVSLAGVGVESIARLIVRQNIDINVANGVDQQTIDHQTRELTDIFEILRVSKDREDAQDKIRKYVIDAGITKKSHIERVVNEFGSVWMYAEAHRDIRPLLTEYNGPVLALFGSKDLLVSASVNEAPTRKLLTHPESEVYLFEGLNHLFQVARKGIGPEEYWEIETTIEEEVIDKIDSWLKSINNNTLHRTGR